MKSGLEHLRETKRRELTRVVEILFAEFEASIAGGKAEFKRQAQILKVILFGSYARGDWVDDPVGGYVSGYDLLALSGSILPFGKIIERVCRCSHLSSRSVR